jgi:hypothetical protein
VRAVQALPQSLVELVRGQSASTDGRDVALGIARGDGPQPDAVYAAVS